VNEPPEASTPEPLTVEELVAAVKGLAERLAADHPQAADSLQKQAANLEAAAARLDDISASVRRSLDKTLSFLETKEELAKRGGENPDRLLLDADDTRMH
jgi:methyl-accepting chemotaxis protein